MIQLNKHIEILLLDNDCVIVPGLGGFMAHHAEARFDDRDYSFLPPLRMIGFNQHLKINDSLLAQSYIETYDMSYPEALRRIENEVEEIKQHLHNEGSYELEEIGILSTNEHGDLIFEPFEAGILTPELYGLSAFEFKPFIKESSFATENSTIGITPAYESGKDAIDFVEDDDEEEGKVIKIRVAWIRNVAAAVAAIVAFLIFTSPVTNSSKDNVMLSSVIIPELLNNDIKVTDIKSVDFKTVNNITDSTTKEKELVHTKNIENKEIVNDSNDFCIILASHITKRNAENFVNELHENGYDQAYTYINNKIVRVAYGNYNTMQDAYNALAKIKTNKKYKEAWVLKKR